MLSFVGDVSQFRGADCVGCKEFLLCLAIQHSHAITSEWRTNVFRTPGAKAVTVWSPGPFLTENRKTLEYKDNRLDYVSTQEGLPTLLC